MDILKIHLAKNFLAHGYFIEGADARGDFVHFYFGGAPHEYIFLDKEKIGIDDIRVLKEKTSLISFEKKKQIVCILARALTREAQSALLKLTEEPPAHTHFFLFGDSEEILSLPLRSRLILIRKEPSSAKGGNNEARRFLKESAESRRKILEAYTTTEELRAFIDLLGASLREDFPGDAHGGAKERFLKMHTLFSKPSVSLTTLKDYAIFLL